MTDNGDRGDWRPMHVAALWTAAVAAASLLLPVAAPAAAGSLDRSFSGDGRLTIRASAGMSRADVAVTRLAPIPMASAAAPNGELVAANHLRVIRLRADGKARRYFGGNGRAVIPTPAAIDFQLAGMEVDSRGRVLVAGTRKPEVAAGGSSASARVGVYRFLPNGKLDAGFGVRGLAGAALGPMEATGLVVDSRDRPLLTGFSALTPSFCNATPVYLNTSRVARLTTRGAPDRSFGSGGVFTDPLEDAHLPALMGNGNLVYVSAPEQRCAGFDGHGAGGAPMVSVVSPRGDLLRRFPASASGSHYNAPTSLAVDRRSRIVTLFTSMPPEGGGILQRVVRLLPDGRPDPEFGYFTEPGVSPAPGVPGGRSWAVTTDGRNRVLVAGSFLRREGRLESRGFLVDRLNAAGRPQAWFGDDGSAKARFGNRAEAVATQVHLDSRGRIVLAGAIQAPRLPGGYGLAFARLLSGRR